MRKTVKMIAKRTAIAEGLNDKTVWDEAEDLDAWLDASLNDDSDGDCDDACLDRCDKCGQSTLLCGELFGTRDVDEGVHGPVYRVCRSCHEKQQAALQSEFEETCSRLGLTPAEAMGQ